jgi:hypothetical protein
MKINTNKERGHMARIRLNNEYRNKIANRIKVHLQQEDTQEKRKYDDLKGKQVDLCDNFSFRLNGSFDQDNNYSSSRDLSYAFALFRDEINAQDDCNADILIEQADKDDNPHKRKFVENNEKYLGLSGGRGNETKYGAEWNNKYQLDLIGRDYCRDRSIACSKQEFDFLQDWKAQKGQFVVAHEKWIESILKQMKEIKVGLKGYKWLDEGVELANELGLDVKDHEIIRTNSSGLVIYNPKNLAERIKGMKNTEKTREQKIADRVAYMQQQKINSDNLN